MKPDITFYLWKDTRRGKPTYKNFSPGCVSRWKNIVSVDDITEADYLVIINNALGPTLYYPYGSHRILLFKRDPDEFAFVQNIWKDLPASCRRFPISNGYMLQHWLADKTYDELASNPLPAKSKDLSWVTTNYGDGSGVQAANLEDRDRAQMLSGHILRMQLLKRFLDRYPTGPLDLFGKRLNRAPYLVKCNLGELYDKWDGLADYRYTLAIENSAQPGYFSEKFCDAVLAGCMPIYWGCPNIHEFFPPGSYIWLDILGLGLDGAINKVLDVIKSDFREQHLAEIAMAKRLVLDTYNIWPTLHGLLNKLAAEDGPRQRGPGLVIETRN